MVQHQRQPGRAQISDVVGYNDPRIRDGAGYTFCQSPSRMVEDAAIHDVFHTSIVGLLHVVGMMSLFHRRS